MAVLTIKSVPEPLHRSLKARATLHKRSLTQEVLVLLEAAVAPSRPVDVEAELASAREFRERLGFTARPEDIAAFRVQGRKS